MKANIFKSLLKYASYTKKKPRENIFTGSFAFLLSEHKGLRNSFVRFLIKRYRESHRRFRMTQGVNLKSLIVSPQSTYRRFSREETSKMRRDQIDIEIGDSKKRFGIFIENKIGADLGYRQDKRYRITLDRQYDKGMLVFITMSGNRKISKNIEHIQVKWSDVYIWLSCHRKRIERTNNVRKNVIKQYLMDKFLEYMEGENMASFIGFKKKEITGKQWVSTYVLASKIRTMLNNLKQILIDNGYDVRPIRIRSDEIYFKITPTNVAKNKLKLRKWKRNGSNIQVGIELYYKKTWRENFDVDFKEGLYPYTWIWKKSAFGKKTLKLHTLSRSGFYFYDERNLANDIILLGDVLGKENNPVKQEKKLINFYLKSLEAIEKSGVIKQLFK